MLLSGARKLRCGESCAIIELGHTIDDQGNDVPYYEMSLKGDSTFEMVEHDDALLPLWEAFAKALRTFSIHCQSRNIEIQFSTCNVEITGRVGSMLAKALKGTSLSTLVFDNFGNHQAILEVAANIAEETPALGCIRLQGVEFNNVDVARRLASVAESVGNIQLPDCGMGKNLVVLKTVLDLTKDCDHLNLSGNGLGREGTDYLASVLKTNPRVRVIILEDSLCDDDIIQLSEALKSNNTISQLTLYPHEMTDRGTEMIEKAVFDLSSLNAMHDCNHSLNPSLGRYNRTIPSWTNSSYHMNTQRVDKADRLKIHRRCKILFALGALDTESLNCNYLRDIPLELLPELLSFIQSLGLSSPNSNGSRGVGNRIISKVVPLQNVFDAMKVVVVPLRFVPSLMNMNGRSNGMQALQTVRE